MDAIAAYGLVQRHGSFCRCATALEQCSNCTSFTKTIIGHCLKAVATARREARPPSAIAGSQHES